MIISKEYGPQLDPTDGTCGNVKLAKRWVLVHTVDGYEQIWGIRQGRYTYETPEEARRMAELYIENNRPGLVPKDLRPAPWWCWPNHFDPACAYPGHQQHQQHMNDITHNPELKTRPDDRATPQLIEEKHGSSSQEFGYTKREDIAATALCSILAGNPGITANAAVSRAIEAADLLIRKLNQ